MEIKSSKEYHGIVLLLFCGIAAFFLVLLNITDSIVVPIGVAILLVIIAVRYWISVGRILIMDSEGCTVQFFLYCRTYRWEDLKTKRYEDYTNRLGYRQPYVSGAIFCSKEVKKPQRIMPAEYSAFVHPFSFFFVYFDPHNHYKKLDFRCPDIYVVDETAFRNSMANWNVEVQ